MKRHFTNTSRHTGHALDGEVDVVRVVAALRDAQCCDGQRHERDADGVCGGGAGAGDVTGENLPRTPHKRMGLTRDTHTRITARNKEWPNKLEKLPKTLVGADNIGR